MNISSSAGIDTWQGSRRNLTNAYVCICSACNLVCDAHDARIDVIEQIAVH